MFSRNYQVGIIVIILALIIGIATYPLYGSSITPIMSSPENNPITIRLETDKTAYSLGDVVEIKVYFLNRGSGTFKATAVDMGYEVLNSNGDVIYSIGATFNYPGESPFTIPAGTEIEFLRTFKWPLLSATFQNSTIVRNDITPGTYTIRFRILSPMEAIATTTVEVR